MVIGPYGRRMAPAPDLDAADDAVARARAVVDAGAAALGAGGRGGVDEEQVVAYDLAHAAAAGPWKPGWPPPSWPTPCTTWRGASTAARRPGASAQVRWPPPRPSWPPGGTPPGSHRSPATRDRGTWTPTWSSPPRRSDASPRSASPRWRGTSTATTPTSRRR